MDSNYKAYDQLASYSRIDAILDAPSDAYEEVDNLPDRDQLTFTNGYYANCTALFIDIRESSTLPNDYKRPVLAKIYRAFISEMVAILNCDQYVREINIVGDCVWAVYRTPRKSDIDDVFGLAYTANSLTQVLNCKMSKRGYKRSLRFGIGIAYGRALMIKAGYSGSGINDVVYMGDVVNHAAKLAARGSKGMLDPTIFVSESVYINLNEKNQGLLRRIDYIPTYGGDVIETGMQQWYDQNCR